MSLKYCFIAGVFFFSSVTTAMATQLFQVDIRDAVSRQAVCNDGTAANYYFRPAVDPDYQNEWVVFLKGGGGCNSVDSCTQRFKEDKKGGRLVAHPKTTAWQLKTITEKGMFSKRSFIGKANLVYIPYCSSDGWIGTADQDFGGGKTVHFKGYYIVKSVIEDLMDSSSPLFSKNWSELIPEIPEFNRSLSDGDLLLLSGSSAGGGGVRNSIDRVAEIIKSNHPDNLVLGVSDANFRPLFPLVSDKSSAFHGSIGDESCMSSLSADKAGYCSSSSYLIQQGHIKTPLFYIVNQIDSKLMENSAMRPADINDQKYFSAAVRGMGLWMRSLSLASHAGLYSYCHKGTDGKGPHTALLHNDRYFEPWTTDIGNISMDEVLSRWVQALKTGMFSTGIFSAKADSCP